MSLILRTTMRGLVREHRVASGLPYACLYDFSVDSDELKPDHKSWLEKNVVPLLSAKESAKKYRVDLVGVTSRTASEKYNYGWDGAELPVWNGFSRASWPVRPSSPRP